MPETTKQSEAGLNEDFSYVSAKDGKTYNLTPKERLFAEHYLEFYGNGVQAVFTAGYECKNAKVAAAIAYENLRKPHIIAYIDSRLVEYGFSDENVEKQHLFTLNQFADLASKNKAIDMFYKLKGKYAAEKVDHTTGGQPFVMPSELIAKNDLRTTSSPEPDSERPTQV